MRLSNFDVFTLKLILFLNFYAKVLLIRFKRREVLNRKYYKTKSSNIKLLLSLSFYSSIVIYDIIIIIASNVLELIIRF